MATGLRVGDRVVIRADEKYGVIENDRGGRVGRWFVRCDDGSTGHFSSRDLDKEAHVNCRSTSVTAEKRKFKVGDRVRIVRDLLIGGYYYGVKDGQTATITGLGYEGVRYPAVTLRLDGGAVRYSGHANGLELLNDNKENAMVDIKVGEKYRVKEEFRDACGTLVGTSYDFIEVTECTDSAIYYAGYKADGACIDGCFGCLKPHMLEPYTDVSRDKSKTPESPYAKYRDGKRTFKLVKDLPGVKKGTLFQEECEDGTQPYSPLEDVSGARMQFSDRSFVEDNPKFFIEVFKTRPQYITGEEMERWLAFNSKKAPKQKATSKKHGGKRKGAGRRRSPSKYTYGSAAISAGRMDEIVAAFTGGRAAAAAARRLNVTEKTAIQYKTLAQRHGLL